MQQTNQPSSPFKLDFAPTSLPKDFLEAIGLMSTSWSALEYSISDAIGGLLRLDPPSTAVIVTHTSMPQKLDQLKAVAVLKFGEDHSMTHEIMDFVEKTKAAQKQRNYVIHNTWCVEVTSKKVFHFGISARGKIKVNTGAPSADEIRDQAASVNSLALEIGMFLRRNSLLPVIPYQADEKGAP